MLNSQLHHDKRKKLVTNPRIDYNAIANHYHELQSLKKSSNKHPMYNALLRLFRKAEIKYSTLNNTMLLPDSHLLRGLMIRPYDTRCTIHVQKKPYSIDLEVSSVLELINKMYQKDLISEGTYNFLWELEAAA
jgi:hypothetical protein